MPTAITRIPLSASTNGRPIKVVATSTPGTQLHQVQTSTVTGCMDVPQIAAYNSDTVDRTITIECGGTTAPDDHVKRTIPAGETVSIPLPPLNNNLNFKAFASAANVVVVSGSVDRIVVS